MASASSSSAPTSGRRLVIDRGKALLLLVALSAAAMGGDASLSILSRSSERCPAECLCRGSRESLQIDCSYRGLRAVPQALPPSTERLLVAIMFGSFSKD